MKRGEQPSWRMSLRWRLIALVIAAVAPVLLFSTAMVYRLGQSEGEWVQSSLRQTVRAVSVAVDREISAAHAVLDVLAASPALQAGDLQTFYREAAVAAGVQKAPIALIERDGRQTIDTALTFDPRRSSQTIDAPGLIEKVLATGLPQVSDAVSDSRSGAVGVVAAVPVRNAAGEITRILGMSLSSARLSAILIEQGLKSNWVAAVLDRHGIIVARTRAPESFVGKPGGRFLRERVLRGDADGVIENVTADGQDVVSTFARSPATAWTVAVGMPRTEATDRIYTTLGLAVGVGIALLILAIVLATLAGQSIAHPVAELAKAAEALGSGTSLGPRPRPAIPELEAVDRSLRVAQRIIQSREEDLQVAMARAEGLAAERAGILGQLMEGVIVTDREGTITFVNDAASRLHGVLRIGIGPDAYAEVYSLFTEDGQPYPAQDLPLARAVLSGETTLDARWRIRRPDGTEVLAIGSASPLRDEAGEIVGAVLTVRDDTAREQAERLLRERESELARVQRIGEVGGLEVSLREGTLQNKRSPEYLRIHGLTVADAYETHDSWEARIHPDDRARTVEHFFEVLAGSATDYEAEYRIIRPSDGAERWILAKAEIERDPDGRPSRLVGAHIDITQRKKVELALEARTRELESVLTTVPAGVWFTHDHDVGKVRRNRYAAELMRVTPGTTTPLAAGMQGGSGITVLANGQEVGPDDLPLQQAMRGVSTADRELAFRFPDGSEKYLISSATALRDERGRIVGAVSVALDITERKRAERHQRLLVNELNHRVKNTLATVQSIAAQTFKGNAASGAARQAFEARLMALSRTHDVLTRESWEGAALREIVERAVSPHGGAGEERFRVRGPDVRVSPQMALALAMSLHELCTNAAKYGALSVPEGHVSITWSVANQEGLQRLHLRWEERGGPEVVPPSRRGFGSRLIERQLANEFGGVRLDFSPEGVVCTIDARLDPEGEIELDSGIVLT